VHLAVLGIEWIVSQDQLTMNLSPNKFDPFHRVVLTRIIELSRINIGSTISIGFARLARRPQMQIIKIIIHNFDKFEFISMI
jgi:hypothetical protein